MALLSIGYIIIKKKHILLYKYICVFKKDLKKMSEIDELF